MTPDTKRAIEIIKPLADQLQIEVEADNRCLYLDGQAIGIGCNSTHATIMEFIGYLMFVWAEDKRTTIPPILADRVQRYWVSTDILDKLKED